MSELPAKKFKYKKDKLDWVIVWIILFTLVCMGLIVYGIAYFDGYNTSRDVGTRNEFNDIKENKEKLEQQINQYLNDPDFDPNNNTSSASSN